MLLFFIASIENFFFFRNKLVIKVEKGGDVANVKKKEYNFFVCEGILGRGKDTAFWVGKKGVRRQ